MTNSINDSQKSGLPKLGESVNLLNPGKSSNWHSFNSPELEPIGCLDVRLGLERINWKELELSMFSSLDKLAASISDFSMLPVPLEKGNPVINPDVLVGNNTAITLIKKTFGINASTGKHYMLLRLNREDSIQQHPGRNLVSRSHFHDQWQLTEHWHDKAFRLRAGKRIHDGFEHDTILPHDKSQKYLDAMYSYGTHFVSQITMGNSLLQLIELAPHIGDIAFNQWFLINQGLPVIGKSIKAFRGFTTIHTATQVSNVVSRFECSVLNNQSINKYWEDPSSLSGENLMNVFNYNLDRDSLLRDSSQISGPLTIELSSLGRFLEFYRSLNFERILKGALLSRWKTKVNVTINRASGFSDMLNHDILDRDFLNNSIGNTVIKQILDFTKTNDFSVASQQWNIAQFMIGSMNSSNAKVLSLNLEQNESLPLFCEHMTGIVYVDSRRTKQRNILLDGLYFNCKSHTKNNKTVFISQDVYKIPEVQLLKYHQEFEFALLRLYQASMALNDFDVLSRQAVSNFAIWISLSLEDNSNVLNNKSSVFAHYLTIVKALGPNRRLGVGAELLEDFDTHVNQIINLLKTHNYSALVTKTLEQGESRDQLIKHQNLLKELREKYSHGMIPILENVQLELRNKRHRLRTSITNLGAKLNSQLTAFKTESLAEPTNQFKEVLFTTIQKATTQKVFNFDPFNLANSSTQPAILLQDFIHYENQLKQHLKKLTSAYNAVENERDDVLISLQKELENYPNRPVHLWNWEVFPAENLHIICDQEQTNTMLSSSALAEIFHTWSEFHNARRMLMEVLEYQLSNRLEIGLLKKFDVFNSNSQVTTPAHSAKLVALELIHWIQLLAKLQMAVLDVLTNQSSQVDLSKAPEHLEHAVINLQSLISRINNKQIASYKSILEPHGI